MEAIFQCRECQATKTIEKPRWMDKEKWLRELPETVPCGVGGCGGRGRLTRDWYINNRRKQQDAEI